MQKINNKSVIEMDDDHKNRLKTLKNRFLKIESNLLLGELHLGKGIKSMRISPESKEMSNKSRLKDDRVIGSEKVIETKHKRLKTHFEDYQINSKSIKEFSLPRVNSKRVEHVYIESLKIKIKSLSHIYEAEISELNNRISYFEKENKELSSSIHQLTDKLNKIYWKKKASTSNTYTQHTQSTRDYGIQHNYEALQFPCYDDLKNRVNQLEMELDLCQLKQKADLMNLSLTIIELRNVEKGIQTEEIHEKKVKIASLSTITKDDEPQISLFESKRKRRGKRNSECLSINTEDYNLFPSNLLNTNSKIIQSNREVCRGDSKILAPSISFTQTITDLNQGENNGFGLIYFSDEIPIRKKKLIQLYMKVNYSVVIINYPCELASLNEKAGSFLFVCLENKVELLPEILEDAEFMISFGNLPFEFKSNEIIMKIEDPYFELMMLLDSKKCIGKLNSKISILYTKDDKKIDFDSASKQLVLESHMGEEVILQKLQNFQRYSIIVWKRDILDLISLFGKDLPNFRNKISVFTNEKFPNSRISGIEVHGLHSNNNSDSQNSFPDVILVLGTINNVASFINDFKLLYKNYKEITIHSSFNILDYSEHDLIENDLNKDIMISIFKNIFGPNVKNFDKKYLINISLRLECIPFGLEYLKERNINFKIINFHCENSSINYYLLQKYKSIEIDKCESKNDFSNIIVKL